MSKVTVYIQYNVIVFSAVNFVPLLEVTVAVTVILPLDFEVKNPAVLIVAD